VIVLNMLGQRRFALAHDRLAQAGQVKSSGKSGAKSDFADKPERLVRRFYATRGRAPEVKITMAFKALEEIRCYQDYAA
jgi:hypothetical protein